MTIAASIGCVNIGSSAFIVPHMGQTTNVQRFLSWCRLAEHSPRTVDRRRKTLRYLADAHGVATIDATTIDRDIIELWLATFDKPETRRAYLNDVRAFCRWAIERDLIDRDPTVGIPTPRVPKRLPTPLSLLEVRAVRAACRTHSERVTVELALSAGLRVSEIAALARSDVTDRQLVVRNGKGGKDRVIPLAPDLAVLLEIGWPTRTSGDSTSNLIAAVLKRAGIRRRPHDLRATFATEVLRATGNVHTVAQLLGHASIATTERYLAFGVKSLPELYGDNAA